MRVLGIGFVLAGFAIALSPLLGPSQRVAAISGTVLMPDGKPAARVSVEARSGDESWRASTDTDHMGAFRLVCPHGSRLVDLQVALVPDSLQLSDASIDHRFLRASVRDVPCGSQVVVLQLENHEVSLRVRVIEGRDVPVVGALVTLTPPAPRVATRVTDAEGVASFQVLRSASYTVDVAPAKKGGGMGGFSPITAQVEGDQGELELHVARLRVREIGVKFPDSHKEIGPDESLQVAVRLMDGTLVNQGFSKDSVNLVKVPAGEECRVEATLRLGRKVLYRGQTLLRPDTDDPIVVLMK